MATYTSDIIKSFVIGTHFPNKWSEVCSFILQIEKLVFLKRNNYKKNLKNQHCIFSRFALTAAKVSL